MNHSTTPWGPALLAWLALAACTNPIEAFPDGGSADAATDSGRDAGPPDAGADAATDAATDAPWDRCPGDEAEARDFLRVARTGDRCTFAGTCTLPAPTGVDEVPAGTRVAIACAGILRVTTFEVCGPPVTDWGEEECVALDDQSHPACGEGVACARSASECCHHVRVCSAIGEEAAMVCDLGCEGAVMGGRTWTACPADPREMIFGEPCEGSWRCAVGQPHVALFACEGGAVRVFELRGAGCGA